MTAWRVEFSATAQRKLRKVDPPIARAIVRQVEELAQSGNPRSKGKPLEGELSGLWRYRVQDWRVIVELHDHTITINVLTLGHRSDVYRVK